LKNDPSIPIAKLDATVAGKTASRFGVSGYPTLKVFRNGKESPYNGPRKAAGIVTYMKKQVGPAAKPLDSIAAVEAFANSDVENGFAVVGFFSSKDSQLHSSFLVVANKMRDSYVFGKVTDPAIAKHFGIEGSEGLIAFKNFDDKKTIYSGTAKTTAAVEEFVKANSFPVVGEMTEENQELYMKRDLPIAKFFLNVDRKSSPKQYEYYTNRLRKIATEYSGRLLVATLYMPKWEHAVTAYNLKGKPDGFVIEKGYEEKYKMDTNFSLDNIKKFVADYFDGELEAYVKSEDVPKEQGPVTVVVGKTFEKIVQDDSKDVLIEFYAPWCGHCKSLAPKYDELGKKFKGVDSVVIGKIDATANDFPRDEFKVSGYPTIFFKPAKAGAKPVLYEGAREVEDMEKFIKSKGKSEGLKAMAGKKDKKKKKKSSDDE